MLSAYWTLCLRYVETPTHYWCPDGYIDIGPFPRENERRWKSRTPRHSPSVRPLASYVGRAWEASGSGDAACRDTLRLDIVGHNDSVERSPALRGWLVRGTRPQDVDNGQDRACHGPGGGHVDKGLLVVTDGLGGRSVDERVPSEEQEGGYESRQGKGHEQDATGGHDRFGWRYCLGGRPHVGPSAGFRRPPLGSIPITRGRLLPVSLRVIPIQLCTTSGTRFRPHREGTTAFRTLELDLPHQGIDPLIEQRPNYGGPRYMYIVPLCPPLILDQGGPGIMWRAT